MSGLPVSLEDYKGEREIKGGMKGGGIMCSRLVISIPSTNVIGKGYTYYCV